jgi:hypothetical protein
MRVETLEDGTSDKTLLRYNGDEIVPINGVEQDNDFSYTSGLITKIVTLDKATQVISRLEYSDDSDQ